MINLIVAAADNNVIGCANKLPWTLKEDMARFKSLTTGNIVIMGRKTFESISRPLENRINIVVSKSLKDTEGLIIVPNLDIAIDTAKQIASSSYKEIFIIGGQSIYQSAIHFADTLYITRVHITPDGDRYFPAIPDNFVLQSSRHIVDNGIDTHYCIYKKN